MIFSISLLSLICLALPLPQVITTAGSILGGGIPTVLGGNGVIGGVNGIPVVGGGIGGIPVVGGGIGGIPIGGVPVVGSGIGGIGGIGRVVI